MDNTKTTNVLPDIKLYFNIKHPNLEDCYVDGYQCALEELQEEDNPFVEGTEEHYHWLEGWWDGFYREKPLFDLTEELAEQPVSILPAANDQTYHFLSDRFLLNFIKISSALAATALIGYQVLDLVA